MINLIANWLIKRAQRRPYTHLPGYMNRWWLFNPYQDSNGQHVSRNWLMSRLPSIRIHHILRPDADGHHHDHPWDARTVVLRGWYIEERETSKGIKTFTRRAGNTARLRFGEYHRISIVPHGGVFTLFITYRYRGTWGFKVEGKKVPYTEYLKDKS